MLFLFSARTRIIITLLRLRGKSNNITLAAHYKWIIFFFVYLSLLNFRQSLKRCFAINFVVMRLN